MTANSLRGEITLTLEGVEYVLRPDFTAITAMEDLTGQSLQELAIAADGGKLSVRNMAVVVTECLKAFGRSTEDRTLQASNADRVAKLIYEAGIMAVQPRVAMVLVLALTGGHKPGEAGAGTKKKTTTGTPAVN